MAITGAGQGIGLGLARAHAAAGWQVTALCRGPGPQDAGIAWVAADVTDPAALAAAAAIVSHGVV